MNAKDNKFLKVNSNVVLTPVIEPVIVALDKYFEKANLKAVVTSGKRTPEDQLRIIRDYLAKNKLHVKYPEAMAGSVNDKMVHEGVEVYKWQLGWSALLNAGVIINPPLRAMCLMNYFNASGVNRKGQYLNPSQHFNGTCVDIGGGANGLNDEIAVVDEAKKEITAIVGWVIERKNNCLHLDCR